MMVNDDTMNELTDDGLLEGIGAFAKWIRLPRGDIFLPLRHGRSREGIRVLLKCYPLLLVHRECDPEQPKEVRTWAH